MGAHDGWPAQIDGTDRPNMVPMMVLVPGQERGEMSPVVPAVSRLDALHAEAMGRFDAFCFWYARPSRTTKGMREVAERLEAYGSPPALRIAADIRRALEEGG